MFGIQCKKRGALCKRLVTVKRELIRGQVWVAWFAKSWAQYSRSAPYEGDKSKAYSGNLGA